MCKLDRNKQIEPIAVKIIEAPFYKAPSFYLSLTAVLISVTALLFSYLASPLSRITLPKITFESDFTLIQNSKSNDYALSMIGNVANESSNPAKEVVVNIISIIKQKPKISLVIQEGIEYEIIKNSPMMATIKFPNFPPRYFCFIIVQGICSEEELKKIKSKERDLLFISGVVHEKGIAIRTNKLKGFN